jgi:hypothetical protein
VLLAALAACVLQPGRVCPCLGRLLPGLAANQSRLVADRIVRYAKIVGPENVIAGTDCGFAQVNMIERVPAPVMWAKFEALVEGARIASQELF